MDEVQIYDRVLDDFKIAELPGLSPGSLIAVAPGQRNAEQKCCICEGFLEQAAITEWQQAWQRLNQPRAARKRLDDDVPTVMVMRQLEKANDTKMLIRGAWDRA